MLPLWGEAEATVADAAEAIIDAIRRAFAGVPPGRITLHEAEIMDGYPSAAECQQARVLDTDVSWDQVPDAAIEECPTALNYLDHEGWRYYVPAYMIWSLRYFRSSDSIVSDFTIYTFDPSASNPQLRKYKRERFRLLDHAQSCAVCRFLRFMAANDDLADWRVANIALTEYWGKFCADSDDKTGLPLDT
jgi:hypothetical protein